MLPLKALDLSAFVQFCGPPKFSVEPPEYMSFRAYLVDVTHIPEYLSATQLQPQGVRPQPKSACNCSKQDYNVTTSVLLLACCNLEQRGLLWLLVDYRNTRA